MWESRVRVRRRTFLALAASTAVALRVAAKASPASASDTLPWTSVAARGANQPYQHGYSNADLMRWTPKSDLFGDLLRARVPLQKRIAPIAATQQNPQLDPTTQLFNMAGDYGNAFFESYQSNNDFSSYLFDYWQYADYYAAWHGMPTAGVPVELYDPNKDWTQKWFEFGAVNLPSCAYTNAAHKNGVMSIGCIFFSYNDRGSQTYSQLLIKAADGSFPLADKLVEVAKYYGFDGYFINQEASVDAARIPDYKKFIQQMRAGGLYIQWYDSVDNQSGWVSYQNALTSVNQAWLHDPDLGDVANSMFLNYGWNHSGLASSRDLAESLGLDPHQSVFTGVEAGGAQFDQFNNLDQDLDSDGRPMNSIATLGADFVQSDMDGKEQDANQWKAFDRNRQWWTGSATGRPGTISSRWAGISKYIAERSVIAGTNFSTTFNTGHGLEYRDAGKVSSDGEWSNINIQDIPVTWQWDVRGNGTALDVDYDYGPKYTKAPRFSYNQIGGYQGGSSLVLAGTVDADSTIRLFRTALDVTWHSRLAISYLKSSASDDTRLSVVVTLTDAPTTDIELPLKASGAKTEGWKTATLDLARLAGKQLATISIKVSAGRRPVQGYQVNVGALRLTDGRTPAPARPCGFTLGALYTDTHEAVVSWDLAPYGKVTEYVVYDNDSFVGGAYDQTLYIKQLPDDKGVLKLFAIGPDGQRSAPAIIEYDLSAAPRNLTATSKADGTVEVTWTAAPGHGIAEWGPARVSITSEYAASPISRHTVIGRGQGNKAVFRGLPVDGGRYIATVQIGRGTPVSVSAQFIDTVVQPYSADLVSFAADGKSMTIKTPDNVADWYKLYVLEDGTPLSFYTTYGSGAKPYIIRGRTTALSLISLNLKLSSPTSKIAITIEDYAGNQATTNIR